MTAAYRLKGIGWFAGVSAVVLGLYLVSLQVAGERKKLEAVNARIAVAERDIRALETEFDTRANLVQLERWNGDTLALSAPVAAQFVADEGALAALDVTQPLGGSDARVATLVVPAGFAAQQPAMTLVAATASVATPGPVARAAEAPAASQADRTSVVRTSVVRTAAAMVRARPQAVAMLDRDLLSDSTLGEILATARTEAKPR